MTISTELRKAGPFTGNGVTTAFPFSFKVFAASDVAATRADTLGAETALVLNSDFTVALNPDQDAAPGGTVTLAAPLATGHRLAVTSAVPNLQPTDITNNGGFYPRVIEDALDRHVAQIQQIDEKVKRALKVAVTSPLGDQALPSPVGGMLIGWNESNDGLKNYAPIGGTLLGQQLAAADGSSLVGFRQASAGAVVRTVESKLRELVSVKDFGAVGDGVTDDTAAVQAAVSSGLPLNWRSLTYRITDTITHTCTAPIQWQSSGATILFDPATSKRKVFNIEVNAASHRITGEFNIDGNLKAFVGFYANSDNGSNYPADYADFVADGLRVRNVYRSSTAFPGGDGIWLRGTFRIISLVNPVVENCLMAAGAGILGSQDIFGITISGNTSGDPLNISILNPYVATIRSEDPSYYADQDGIRIVTSPEISVPSEPSVKIIGGTIRNAYGRSIKIQCEYGLVSGTKFIRTQGFDRGYGNQEIDFQEGGGTVENVECIYNGSAPSTIVNFSGTRQVGKTSVPLGSIDGIKVVVHPGAVLTDVWGNAPFESDAHILRVRNVEVRGGGTLTNVCRFNAANGGTRFHLLMSDIVAAPTGVWVVCGSGAGSGTLKANRLIHLGGSAAYLRSSTSGSFRPFVSADECVNFVQANSPSNTTTPMGVLKRLPYFAAPDATKGGTFRVLSGVLADGASVELPNTEASLNAAMLLIAMATNNTSHAIVSASNAAALIVAQPGTSFVAGATSDPGTGSYRVWKSANGYTLQNNSGASRDYTVMLIG